MTKKKTIRTAVIGYGGAFNMGLHHFREMQMAGMEPAAVCDKDLKRIEAAAKDLPGIQTFTSVATMLRKTDANLVTVITPHNTHARLVVQCLEAGKHVVVEKPMAITTAECDKMIATAKRKRRLLSAYHNRHWDGCVLQAMKTVESGVLGEVYRISAQMGGRQKPNDWWRSRKSLSGGILHDWGVHILEYILQITGAKVVEVSGMAHRGYWAQKVSWGKDAIEDEGYIVLRFDNGAWATLCMTDLAANHDRPWIEVTGTEGVLALDHDTYACTTYKRGETVIRKGRNPQSEWPRYYQNIAEHLTKRRRLIITPEWSRRPIHIIDLACQSATKGVAMKAKYG